MLGRLFERLQEAVESLLREHVHFVDDVDLGPGGDGAVARVLDDLAHVVDAGMRSRVHLDHVDMTRLHDRLAMDAEFGHVDARRVDLAGNAIIEGAGENARSRGFADAAHAGQDIGLMDAARGEGVGERPDHRLLADEVLEPLGAVFARENAIGRGGCRRGGGRGFDGKQRIRHRPPLPFRFDRRSGSILNSRSGRLGCGALMRRRSWRRWEVGQRPALSR